MLITVRWGLLSLHFLAVALDVGPGCVVCCIWVYLGLGELLADWTDDAMVLVCRDTGIATLNGLRQDHVDLCHYQGAR